MNLVLGRRDLTSETVNDMELGKASYDYLDVYLKDGIVVFWKEKKTINDGGLEKSLAAYLKAYDLDKGNASTLKKVQEGVTTLYNATNRSATITTRSARCLPQRQLSAKPTI